MILLTLSRGKGEETVRLQLPASPAEIGETFAFLDRISLDTTATAILDVSSNVPVLYRCLYDVDVEDSEQFQKLQKLAERTEALSPAKAAIFSGALDAECVWNLEGALTVADRLDEYMLVNNVSSDSELGIYLVNKGITPFPDRFKPYINYARVGAEYREKHGGEYSSGNYVQKKTPELLENERLDGVFRIWMENPCPVRVQSETAQITLPATFEQLESARQLLGVDSLNMAKLTRVEALRPYLGEYLPLQGMDLRLEQLDELAENIRIMDQEDGALLKYLSVLEVEQPATLQEALRFSIELDDYERVPDDPEEYGKQVLERIGADEELISMQRKACHDFAAKMGWVIVGEEQETGVSGYKVSADDRDKLQLIKKYAEQGKFDILLVFMFDRLGRKSDETPFVVEWFTKKGVRVWSVQEGEQRFESHTDRLTNYIRFWQADGESQKTSMRTKTALGQMVEEGRFRGGNAPYGYRLEKSGILNKRKHEVYMLVIDEDEARVVRMMFDLCISSGYGRWRLANFLNDHGIKNRKGQNWHDASVGGILHNPLYKGILRSGETYAGPFEALQIIAPDQFDLAQKLMLERTNERKERRTVPLNTTGQSLLSGNIFCGHCGGRLVLTTNGTTTRLADGTPVHKKRIRYVCYNKTRRRQECTGQTGYTMHILDGIVTEVLHQVFDKMQGASNDMIVGSAVQKQMAMIRSELQRARAENTKANKEYESLKAEVLKAIQGKSALPQDVLTEMLEDTRQKVLSTSERITTLTAELNDGNSKIEEMKAEFNRIVSWSKIFDESPMEVKKMICGYIIKKVSVFRDYRIKIEFNINVEQFLNGIDSIDECATYELPMAQ